MKNFDYFYFSGYGLPSGNNQWPIYYDFSQGNNPVPSRSNALYSATIGSPTSFYAKSGSGAFNGAQSLSIANSSGLNANSFSAFFVYENIKNGVLFSTLHSGTGGISGYLIGLNSANRMYFESFDQQGSNIRTSSNIYGTKNAVAVVKSNNNLAFHYYNFNSQSIESEQFTTSLTANYQSNQAYLGAPINAPNYVTELPYSGYIDQFLYINQALTPNVVQGLFSGCYASKNPSTVNYIAVTENIVTGIGINTNGATGITGYRVYFSGYVFDNAGNKIPIYEYNNLTGILNGGFFAPLTGQVTYQYSGLTDNGFFIDSGYCNGFGMDKITYLDSVSGQKEVYTFQPFNNNINYIAKYNSDGTFKLDKFYTSGQIDLYANGISYIPSGYFLSGQYINTLILQGDFAISGQSVLSNGFFGPTNSITYDVISGLSEKFFLTNTGNASFTTSLTQNRLIFLNGVKLVSGQDYNFAGSTLNVIGMPATGIITNLPFPSDFAYSFNENITRFGRDTSAVWLNGQRLTLNNDYVESANVDLLGISGLSLYNTKILNSNLNFSQSF